MFHCSPSHWEGQRLLNVGDWLQSEVWAQADTKNGKKEKLMEEDKNRQKREHIWDMLVDPWCESLSSWLFSWFISVR